MRRHVAVLAAFLVTAFATITLANDLVTVRSKDKPHKGVIKSESSRGVEVAGVKGLVPAEDIIDIFYEVSPTEVLVNLYRPADRSEKDYYDPDPKKESKRKANLGDALKKYAEAYAKVNEKSAKRHLEFKVAVLTVRQAQEEGTDLGPGMKRLTDFKAKNPNSWQLTSCLELLARLQTQTKQYKNAEATYLELAAADVAEETKREAELSSIQVGAKAGLHEAALKKLDALISKLPKDSKFLGRARITQAECLLAAKKDTEAVALLRQATREAGDKGIKALAHNTLGVHYYQSEQLKEARWEFLWVDAVYNQDKAEHGKALYHLSKIFDRLSDKQRAQECRSELLSDRVFAGTEWQRLALKDLPK